MVRFVFDELFYIQEQDGLPNGFDSCCYCSQYSDGCVFHREDNVYTKTKRRKKGIVPRQKKSTYNFAATKMSLGLDYSASYAEVCAAFKSGAIRALPLSPDNIQVKSKAKLLRKNVARKS